LRSKIFKKVKPKLLKNQIINGPMLIELAEAYSKALNGGKIPTIENAWNYVQASELDRAFKEVVGGELDKLLHERITKKIPLSEEAFKVECQKIKNECLLSFKSKALCGEMQTNAKGMEYIEKLKT
jgi:Guanylate-binding protein, C-terminal domain